MKDVINLLLEEAQQHVITVELNSGESYRGKLFSSEGNMNLQLVEVQHTNRHGVVSSLNETFIRGSHIQMVHLPEMLKYAPVLQPKLLEESQAAASKKRKR